MSNPQNRIPPNLASLPAEIKLEIFKVPMPNPRLLALRLTCKAFNQVFFDHKDTIKKAEMMFYRHSIKNMLEEVTGVPATIQREAL